jgi:hypothetical protein
MHPVDFHGAGGKMASYSEGSDLPVVNQADAVDLLLTDVLNPKRLIVRFPVHALGKNCRL